MDDLYDLVERAMDCAFIDDKYLFKCYNYLKSTKATRSYTRKFIESSTAGNIALTIADLDAYIKGGSDNEHKILKEAYGHLKERKVLKIQ